MRNKPAQLLHSLGNAYLRAFLFFEYSQTESKGRSCAMTTGRIVNLFCKKRHFFSLPVFLRDAFVDSPFLGGIFLHRKMRQSTNFMAIARDKRTIYAVVQREK